ncbi:MAG TPA: nucleotidyltransferase family protein [Thermoanaerobaculia bacterium]|nr:nucleotidyltransferase family protein [Thermoanaerobaculia bacterium]
MPRADTGLVAGVVLAAGSSTRMGRNKLLLPIGRETVVRRAVREALEAGLDPVVVVLGHEAEEVRAELRGLPCLAVVNADHALGVGTSLRAGIAGAAAETRVGAAVVLLADMPFVTASSIRTVVEKHRVSRAPLVLSRYGDVDAPPTLYDRSLFPELLALAEGHCGKKVVRRHAHEAAVVASSVGALRDIDIAEDYERARADLAEA